MKLGSDIVGLDVGSRTLRGVRIDAHGEVVTKVQRATNANMGQCIEDLLAEIGGSSETYVVSTGFGRYQVARRQIQVTDMTAHAYGAFSLVPGARTVLDVGAQMARAMRLGEDGRVRAFKVNDKCASGAGRFLERVAKSLEIPLDHLADLSFRSHEPISIGSICAVLAESEIINHVTEGRAAEDIVAGVHLAVASRIAALVKQVGVVTPVVLSGGVALNMGMVRALEKCIGDKIVVSPDAEFAGAIGAARLASRRLSRTSRS